MQLEQKHLQYLMQNLPSSSNLSTQDNSNPLEKLKSGFKQKSNSNEYRSNVSTQTQNQYLDYLVDACFLRCKYTFCLAIRKKYR